jgi:hypothetical protein
MLPPRGLDLACQLPPSSQVSIFNGLFDVLFIVHELQPLILRCWRLKEVLINMILLIMQE